MPIKLHHVGRAIADYNGVDIGLYIVSSKVFIVLDNLVHGVGSLSFPESLAFGFQRVYAMATTPPSDLWFGVDSHDQMVHTVEHDLVRRLAILSPEATAMPSSPPASSSPPPPLKRRASLVLAVTSSKDQPHAKIDMRRPSSRRSDAVEAFQGFVVHVPHLQPSETHPLNQELSLGVVPVGNCVLPGDISLEGRAGDEYVLAIPTAPTPSSTLPRTSSSASSPLLRRLSPRKSAFLVPQHESDGHTRSFLLAVPVDRTNEPLIHPPTLRSTLRRLSALPSDVKDVTLEASMVGGMMEMQLTVTKQVPWVGFVILAGALLSVSAQGAALQMLTAVPPLVKMVWRYFGSSVLFGCLTWWLDGGLPSPPSGSWVIVGRDTLLCSAAYVVFSATFIWALDHTSVGHAYIFTNSHSILLVVGKCMFGQPVAGLEAAGAFLGIAGGVITSADHESTNTATNGASQHPPTLEGDIVAFVGAIGGVAYLIYAKTLQELLGVRLFCFCLFTTTWVLLLPLLWIMQEDLTWSSDPVVGLFGWTHHLGIEGVLVVVVSACGTMGFITSMKYFPPLVVSVTMLLEPIVATIMCIIVGTATTPGWVTFVGGSVVIAGTLLVICSTSNTAEVTNISEAMVVQSQDNGGTPKGYGACS
ncbi:hypothetical protein DYB28_003108 [Aphanomyces astaci]|uniref:EamA domain-containing protein n=1 Tax=Aphanomyces astaci TaxID=112090 RepID=A0A9X8HHX3_APHAT|nr:hypothetical protein DYB28_003108 [Aphanomyces astaci]